MLKLAIKNDFSCSCFLKIFTSLFPPVKKNHPSGRAMLVWWVICRVVITANKSLRCPLWQQGTQVPQGWLCWLPPEECPTFFSANKQIDLGLVKALDSVRWRICYQSSSTMNQPLARRKLESLFRAGQLPSEAPGQGKLQTAGTYRPSASSGCALEGEKQTRGAEADHSSQ